MKARPADLSKLRSSGSDVTLIEELTWLDGAAVAARHLEDTITLRCRNRCLSCPQPKMRRDIPWKVVSKGLQEYARRPDRRVGEMELVLTGGEPSMAKSFLDIARLGRDLGFGAVSVISSSESYADARFARAVYDAGIRRVLLSFHSHRPKVYHFFTGTRGQYDRAVRGFSNCLSLPFASVSCNMVVNRLNYRDVPAHAAFLAGLGAAPTARAPLSLVLSVLEENPKWENLCVPHRAAAPYIRRACEEGRLPIRRFAGDWTMPVCVGGLGEASPSLAPLARRDSATWYAPRGWTPSGSPPPEAFRRVKASACRGCAMDPVCAGLGRTYAGRFGTGELAPVPRRLSAPGRGERILSW
ncbi:MAG: radical SAM protein [Elusimicrobia bacterium]|nr:radical SAM protein [Elusimicrobiota bacterium]